MHGNLSEKKGWEDFLEALAAMESCGGDEVVFGCQGLNCDDIYVMDFIEGSHLQGTARKATCSWICALLSSSGLWYIYIDQGVPIGFPRVISYFSILILILSKITLRCL